VADAKASRRSGGGLSIRPRGSHEAKVDAAGTSQTMGHSADEGQPERGSGTLGKSPRAESQSERSDRSGDNAKCQTQSAVVRDPHGPARGVGYAELCVTSDNRTDELRLLGNGVVPATAERAFRVLFAELT
jgi:hypothetical protein